MAREVVFSKWVDDHVEEDSTVIVLGDDERVTIPPPVLWPDETVAMLLSNPAECGRLAMGDEAWEKFTAAGGTGAAFLELVTSREELTPGESPAS